MNGSVSVRTVTQTALTVAEHGRADDSQTTLPATAEKTATEQKLRKFLRVFEKINMVFILLFVCYLSWTIPAHYGLYSGKSGTQKSSGNHSSIFQADDSNSTEKYIPLFSDNDEKHVNATYHTDIVLPTHRKASKRRRKKDRNRKRHKNRSGRKFYANIEDYLNLTDSSFQGKNSCKDCKIRKRKGRNRYRTNRMNTTVLRKILERVADDTLSGARSGDGTLSSLLDISNKATSYKEEKPHINKHGSEWESSPNWLNLATLVGYSGDENRIASGPSPCGLGGRQYGRIDHLVTVIFFYLSPSNDHYSKWSEWSHCSTSCGAGQQERTRRCGSTCKEVESMVCMNPSCEGMDTEVSAKTITEFYQWEKEGFIPPVSKPEQEFLDHGVDACGQWLKCNRQIAQEFIEKSSLPACPCTFPLKRVKSKALWDAKVGKDILWLDVSTHDVLAYKQGATYCIRQKLVPGAITLAVQQCCYDSGNSLLTRGMAAGTPNQVSPYISKELHYKVDLLPWIICKGDWTRYNKVLPPNNDLSCLDNPTTEEYERQKAAVKNY